MGKTKKFLLKNLIQIIASKLIILTQEFAIIHENKLLT